MKTAIEHYKSLLEVNFETWRKQGITCILLDVDSTVAPWLGSTITPEMAHKLAQARKVGITHIGLVTNSRQKAAERIADIAQQCGADGYFLPGRLKERKPSPSLIRKALEQFGVKPEQAAMAGDKYTADVLAAKRAGLAKAAWVDRLGKEDLLLDRLIRRPAETPIKMLHRRKSKNRLT